MCGIFAVWNREAVFPKKVFEILFEEAEKRGFDGFGFSINTNYIRKFPNHRFSEKREVLNELYSQVKIRDVVLGICRAQPETECDSSQQNMQPILKEDTVLVHNGSVSEHIVKKYSQSGYLTQIDSEAIINCYLYHQRNMKETMENLVGGFAFILYDQLKNRLYCVNDFKPLAISYFRGYGFIIHSSIEALEEVVSYLIDTRRTGLNVWEDYYFHWQDGYTIREIDLDSGMQRIYSFTPNFYHPVWNNKIDNGKELCLVICSGGIDSSLTAYILKLAGYDVKLVHFIYGQKSQEAEELAVRKLSEWMNIDVYYIDLGQFYQQLNDPSMLLKSEIPVETGKEDLIKTTAAWVAARNLLFLTKTVAIAEAEILRENWKKVWIAAGFSNLSEEGHYPDNSEYFIKSFFETIKYGCITANRISFLPLLKNIMKYEEWILGNALGFRFDLTCSCDEARVINNEIYLCGKCGSDYLSQSAARMAGVRDPRKFYSSRENLNGFIQFRGKEVKKTDPKDIIRRLILPEDRKQKLLKLLQKGGE